MIQRLDHYASHLIRFVVSVRPLVGIVATVVLLGGDGSVQNSPRDQYLTHIKPLLRARCYACHGPLKQQARLRLDTAALIMQGSKSGAVLEPGNAAGSRIIERVTATDPAQRMPPEHEGDPLSAEQVALLRRWIDAGAPAPADEQPEPDPKDHWSFQPIVRPAVPAIAADWARNPIDSFLANRHADHGLIPQVEAPRIVLLRRLYLDLIGIPPGADEIAAFEHDTSPDWYERAVHRLLDDPRHGERWARHWMDIWRYSDWWGLGDQLRNSQPHIWHWRDWIVESLNRDLPYDEMLRQMLAADELYPNELAKLRATGYLARNWYLFNRNQWMEETVEHVGKAFLGLTLNCAKCHAHKFDPIDHADFFRMRAFFEPYHVRIDLVPGEADPAQNGIPRAFDGLLDAPTYRFERGDEKHPDTSIAIAPGVPDLFTFAKLHIEPVTLPAEAAQPERRPWIPDAHAKAAQAKVQAAETELAAQRKRLDEARKLEAELAVATTPAATATPPAAETIRDPLALASDSKTPSIETARSARIEAELRVAIADAALLLARAEEEAVARRAEAMQAQWVEQAAGPARHDAVAAAVAAERAAALAKAKRALAEAELAHVRAAADKKEAAARDLEKARAAVLETEKIAAAPIAPDAPFTPLAGANWTPTRFLNSSKDDPAVAFPATSTGRRTALARWITDHRNPLAPRVAVNHIWTRHMVEPLVTTVFDFGRNGVRPAHPELVDWLAAEFVENGWSMKHLHRLIVTSAAYRMSSSLRGREANMTKDPDNRFWWRRLPGRLESQVVRDSILALAGTLDATMGGAPVPRDQQANSTRRSLYFCHSNNERNLFLSTFDEALVRDCYRREQSIVPQQALALTHSALVLDASGRIAERLGQDATDEAAFLHRAFAVVVGIRASDAELASAAEALAAWRELPDASDQTARAQLIRVLLNHNDFVTIR